MEVRDYAIHSFNVVELEDFNYQVEPVIHTSLLEKVLSFHCNVWP